jgi:hypothetical protein
MRVSLIDVLIALAIVIVGALIAMSIFYVMVLACGLILPSETSEAVVIPASMIAGICFYLALAAPIYRHFRFLPMLLPRCPCCEKRQEGFHFLPDWPRIRYRCPQCDGEFVIWHNGRPTDEETWDNPVLVLKWPYVLGRYKRAEKPNGGG